MWTLLNAAEDSDALLAEASVSAPNPAYNYTSPNISSYALTASAIANLGFKELLNVRTSGDVYYYVIDVAAYTQNVIVKKAAHDATRIIYREGIGFRVGLVAWNIKAHLSVNLGSVAASSQLEGGQTSVSAHAFAGDVAKLGDVARVSEFGGKKFDAKMLQDLAGFVSKLAMVVAKSGHEIPPKKNVARGVLNPNLYSPRNVIASNSYAIEQIWHQRRRSGLADWLANGRFKDWTGNILSPTIIAAAYESLGVDGYHSPITEANTAAAKELQKVGL